MSLEASGTLANTLTFAKWKGRPYSRQRVIPANPKSAAQLGVRAMMSFLAKQWAGISASPKASWEADATTNNISSFNQYVKANLMRWQMFKGPTQGNPAAELSTALTVTTHTSTGGEGHVTHTFTPSGGTSIWGYILFRATAEITTANWNNAVAVIEADGANPVTYVDSPLDAGTYHYRVAAINVDGVIGTAKADQTATVT